MNRRWSSLPRWRISAARVGKWLAKVTNQGSSFVWDWVKKRGRKVGGAWHSRVTPRRWQC
jgi:hypothetical protein